MTDSRLTQELDGILDDCLDQVLNQQKTVEECLALYPDYAEELAPLLRVGLLTQQLEPTLPTLKVDMLESQLRAHLRYSKPLRRLNRGVVPFSRLVAAIAAIIIVTFSGTVGLIASSSSSLPGDALYGVKRGWEQVVIQLAPLTGDLDSVYLQLAQTRRDEVMALDAAGRLTEASLSDLQVALKQIKQSANAEMHPTINAFLSETRGQLSVIRLRPELQQTYDELMRDADARELAPDLSGDDDNTAPVEETTVPTSTPQPTATTTPAPVALTDEPVAETRFSANREREDESGDEGEQNNSANPVHEALASMDEHPDSPTNEPETMEDVVDSSPDSPSEALSPDATEQVTALETDVAEAEATSEPPADFELMPETGDDAPTAQATAAINAPDAAIEEEFVAEFTEEPDSDNTRSDNNAEQDSAGSVIPESAVEAIAATPPDQTELQADAELAPTGADSPDTEPSGENEPEVEYVELEDEIEGETEQPEPQARESDDQELDLSNEQAVSSSEPDAASDDQTGSADDALDTVDDQTVTLEGEPDTQPDDTTGAEDSDSTDVDESISVDAELADDQTVSQDAATNDESPAARADSQETAERSPGRSNAEPRQADDDNDADDDDDNDDDD